MRLGVRCHDVVHNSLEDLSKFIGDKNFKSVHLALQKIKLDFNFKNSHITPGMAKHVRDTFGKNGVSVDILGCYVNLAHPDDTELKKLLDRFKEHIRFARDMGCSLVGTETGALNKEYVEGPENLTEEAFLRTLNSVKILVKEAEKFGVIVAIEGVAKHVINTPERMKRVLDNIESNNLQVIFDPTNYMTVENYKDQDEMMRKSFELFGDRIVAIHAKDFVIENNEVVAAPIGKGLLNYELLLSLAKENVPYIDIFLEATKPEDLDSSIEYVTEVYENLK
ncbi:sugar phosphate isomerase/epimerase [Clostridium sp. SHJSY1]|uniref:sugar phosphate isomerase/epimerase family protein n=1 Tax=Clostridium sp. SHJSY1 TaxID=2942483 RepID=UPI002874FCBA|nr:sugar phosphate isomerase/epimerase family protein [Clostridium sp. SHJSY1]MDS0528447.1 sugar phosphate isomerase/epimerase [Clostridium sp. SHJSY1]